MSASPSEPVSEPTAQVSTVVSADWASVLDGLKRVSEG